MLEACRDPDLAEKPLTPEERRQLRAQHFDSNVAAVLQILREEDQGHTACRDLAFHEVSPGERPAKNR